MLYNNMMFTVASHLVEVKTGKSFSQFLRERFFEPLGMTSTYLQASSAIAAGQGNRIASGHQYDEEKESWDEFDAFDAPEAQGAGSILTSTADYINMYKPCSTTDIQSRPSHATLSLNLAYSLTQKTTTQTLSARLRYTAWAGKHTTTVGIK
jgi:CubicO group peptidase (beta-lactamase class C family)